MSRLIVLTAMTVDGVMTVEEWFVPEGDHMEASLRLFEGDTALLYGRKNYEGLAAYWMAAEGEWADLLNPMPKFVASRTLQEPLTWNATLLKGELEDAVAKLKAERDGDLITNGCGELTRNLLAAGLVDEFWFSLHPAVWGKGERPFWEEEKLRLTLLGTETYDSGVVLLRYEPQRT
ncbi:MAG: dihydrofolate reductase family protein [Candidatus Rokuibacteriota bacterium]|jgi:dihydrofolate reductase